jgi:hypothetical protein
MNSNSFFIFQPWGEINVKLTEYKANPSPLQILVLLFGVFFSLCFEAVSIEVNVYDSCKKPQSIFAVQKIQDAIQGLGSDYQLRNIENSNIPSEGFVITLSIANEELIDQLNTSVLEVDESFVIRKKTSNGFTMLST